jgi:putative hemolysin
MMQALSRIFSPLVRILGASTGAMLRLLRIKPSIAPPVTEDEVKAMIQEGTQAGIFEASEQDMVSGIFRLSDLRVGSLMTPRSEIVWLDLEDPLEVNSRKILESKYGRFPVGRGGLDDWIGIVQSKDLLNQALNGEPIDLETRLIRPLVVPESMLALKVLDMFQDSGVHIALAIDEFGVLQGLVTIFDILEAIVGDIPVLGEPVEAGAVQREDGSWLLDGMLPVDEFKEIFHLPGLPDEARGYYQTVAGFVINYVGRIPSAGDRFEWGGIRFEIMDMDGLRVDKILVLPPPGAATGSEKEGG